MESQMLHNCVTTVEAVRKNDPNISTPELKPSLATKNLCVALGQNIQVFS